MNKTNATGYFRKVSASIQKKAGTKIHYIMSNGKCACGYKPHPSMEFVWCSDGSVLDFLECSKCRQRWGKAFLAWHTARTVRKVTRLNMQKATSCDKGRQFLVPDGTTKRKARLVKSDFSKVERAICNYLGVRL